MSFRRYEILLPTRYNDGAPVEAEKFDLVIEELSNRFGGITFHPEHLRGVWFHQGQKFEEANVRVVVDVEDSAEATDFSPATSRYSKSVFDRSTFGLYRKRFASLDIWTLLARTSNDLKLTLRLCH
jgi:hypothetical protein